MNRMSRMLLTVVSVLVGTVALGGIFDGMAAPRSVLRDVVERRSGILSASRGCASRGAFREVVERRSGILSASEGCALRSVLSDVVGAMSVSPNLMPAGTQSLDSCMDIPSSGDIAETPFAREEQWMLESTRIRVRPGWHHAKVIVPRTEMCCICSRYAVSVPVDTTGGNPKEVEGLIYASAPPP